MTIATTSYGRLRGEDLGGLHVFRGIPFAAPPVGPLRWKAPQPALAWEGERDATRFGPACLQAESPVSQALAMNVGETAEDCLTLNIWTPSTGGRRPVMVWIHGGAFVIGSGAQDMYDGQHLARRGGVVVVTINYRLGILGFLRGADLCGVGLDSTGNEGILDQVAALRWVREEIANFGGDPAQVTVFGESAGSISIATLLATPVAKGLFSRAILQSGSGNLVSPREAASALAAKVFETAGVAPADAGAVLGAMPAAELMALQTAATPRESGLSWSPVVDGEVVPVPPFQAIAGGSAAGVDILAGTTRDELKLFAFMDPGVFQLDEAGLSARAEALAPGRGTALVAVYRGERERRGEAATPFEVYEAMATDATFRVPTTRLLDLQRPLAGRTYSYLFTHQSPSLGGMLGACHALELPFVWGTLGLEAMKAFAGAGEAVGALSARMMDAWLAFATAGDPSHEGLPAWPEYDPARRATMLFGPSCEVADAPLEAERAAWA